MGKTYINNKPVIAPADRVTVAKLKELANVPANKRLYDKAGKVLDDRDVVDTDEAEFGVVPDWTRG